MKDIHARVLAIIALVFMGIFVVALTMTFIDYKMLNGSIGFVALGTGVFAIMILVALKADGRGFSITKMKNDAEMEKIEKQLAEQQKAEEQKEESDGGETKTDEGAEAHGDDADGDGKNE